MSFAAKEVQLILGELDMDAQQEFWIDLNNLQVMAESFGADNDLYREAHRRMVAKWAAKSSDESIRDIRMQALGKLLNK